MSLFDLPIQLLRGAANIAGLRTRQVWAGPGGITSKYAA